MSIHSLLGLVLLGLANSVVADLQDCGTARFDPAQYVCWDDEFLCPVIAGEGLSWCSGTCYSKFMYTCTNSVLALLPAQTSPFALTVSNPDLPIDGWPVNAAGQKLFIGGETASYCPEQVAKCPPGNVTALLANNGPRSACESSSFSALFRPDSPLTRGPALDVKVPGGQQVFLGPDWTVGFTQAHSAYVPTGSRVDAFGAYAGGGFVNLAGDGRPWVACPPVSPMPGADNVWTLVARNSTNAADVANCSAVNLATQPLPDGGDVPTWQYT